MRKFDTCFFERYAQITLETVLGEEYADLVNEDRPDLQKPDHSLGIEVTRAMEPRKEAALTMLKEMAGLHTEADREEMGQIISSGYGYGLQEGRYVGHLEYEYWSLALPLHNDSTGSSQHFTPMVWAISTRALGPNCFIRNADMLLELFVRPHLRVTVLPIHSGLSVLLGVQISSPITNDCGTLTTLSQGV